LESASTILIFFSNLTKETDKLYTVTRMLIRTSVVAYGYNTGKQSKCTCCYSHQTAGVIN